MPFTSRQLELLSQNCYGVTDLPDLLERMQREGPGDYAWPPAPGQYEPEDIPLFERIFAQIWHQGDLYPATYVAVPVWCEVIAQFPEISHARVLGLMSLIETTRPVFQQRLLGQRLIQDDDVVAYEQALRALVVYLPRQLTLLSDSTPAGLREVEGVLALLAFALGQRWTGTLLSRHGLPLNLSAVGDVADYVLTDDLLVSLRSDNERSTSRTGVSDDNQTELGGSQEPALP